MRPGSWGVSCSSEGEVLWTVARRDSGVTAAPWPALHSSGCRRDTDRVASGWRLGFSTAPPEAWNRAGENTKCRASGQLPSPRGGPGGGGGSTVRGTGCLPLHGPSPRLRRGQWNGARRLRFSKGARRRRFRTRQGAPGAEKGRKAPGVSPGPRRTPPLRPPTAASRTPRSHKMVAARRPL